MTAELGKRNGAGEAHGIHVEEVEIQAIAKPIVIEENLKLKEDKTEFAGDGGDNCVENDNDDNLQDGEQYEPSLASVPVNATNHVPEPCEDDPKSKGLVNADNGHESQFLEDEIRETKFVGNGQSERESYVLVDENCDFESQDVVKVEEKKLELHCLVSEDNEPEVNCVENGDHEAELQNVVNVNHEDEWQCVIIEEHKPETWISAGENQELETESFVTEENKPAWHSLVNGDKEIETFVESRDNEVELQCVVDRSFEVESQSVSEEYLPETQVLLTEVKKPELHNLANGDNKPEACVEKGDKKIELEGLVDVINKDETQHVVIEDHPPETEVANCDVEMQESKPELNCLVNGKLELESHVVNMDSEFESHHVINEGNEQFVLNENKELESQCVLSEDNELELQGDVNENNHLESHPAFIEDKLQVQCLVNGDSNPEASFDADDDKDLESQCLNGDNGIVTRDMDEEEVEEVDGKEEILELECDSCIEKNIDVVLDAADEKTEACNSTQESNEQEAITVDSDWVSTVAPEPSNGLLGPSSGTEQKPEPEFPKKMVYCLVKIPRHVDNKIKAQIRLAQLQLNEKTERRDFIRAALQMKRASREKILNRLRTARYEERVLRDAIKSKRQEMEPVQLTLNKMKNATSVEGVDEKIFNMEYRIEHESMPLREEKQLLWEIKQLKLSRDQLCASAGPHAELQEAFDQEDKIQERSKLLAQEIDSLRKQIIQAENNTKVIEKDFIALNDALKQVQSQWNAADAVRQEAYEALRALKRQEYERNNDFFQNRGDIQAAKQYALARDREALDEFCSNQVERIMEMWNKNAEFRIDYMKDNERSTLKRLETLDGRSLGPDEEPPLLTNYSDDLDPSPAPQVKPSASSTRPGKEDGSTTATQQSNDVESKTNGQHSPSSEVAVSKNISVGKSRKSQRELPDPVHKIESFETSPVSVKKEEEEDLAKKEEEAAKMKERRRLEEMTKAKEAEERKRRLAEKAHAKALARAQKEAERKEKERQKRANKKAAAAAATSANTTARDVVSSSDNVQVNTSQDRKSSVIEVEEKPTTQKSVTSQRKKLVSQKTKPKSVFLSAKKGRKGLQTWMWILLGVVLCLSLLIFHQLYF
eukprot:Gb_21139 [translate_table: standard]